MTYTCDICKSEILFDEPQFYINQYTIGRRYCYYDTSDIKLCEDCYRVMLSDLIQIGEGSTEHKAKYHSLLRFKGSKV